MAADGPLSPHSARAVLEAFAVRGIDGAFFILGLAAEKAADRVREIQQTGHEIQSHDYGHKLMQQSTPDEFRQDLNRSKKLLKSPVASFTWGRRRPCMWSTLEMQASLPAREGM